MILLLLAIFVVYNFILLYYASSVFEFMKSIFPFVAVTSVINGALMVWYIYSFDTMRYEFMVLVTFVIVYSIAFQIMYNRNWLVVFFGVSAFTINFIARRILTLAVLSLLFGQPMSEIYQNVNNRILMFMVPFLISSPYILATKKFLHKKYMDKVIMNRENVKFSTSIMSYVCFFLALSLFFLGDTDVSTGYAEIYLIIGALTSVSYHVAIGLAFAFANMQVHIDKIQDLKRNIKEHEENIKVLENKQGFDHFTGLMTRDSFEKKIDEFIAEKANFYLVFIDIDGLKHVNDTFGHTEGDFYIKQVSETIRKFFKDDIVSRYGGDEFLILGKAKDYYAPVKKAVMCYENTTDIQKYFKKRYPTSISYGIARSDSKTTKAEIIKEADDKMYEFKKGRKKQRTDINFQ